MAHFMVKGSANHLMYKNLTLKPRQSSGRQAIWPAWWDFHQVPPT